MPGKEEAMKYRKIPVEIEAFKWTGGPDQEEDPEWIIDAIKGGSVWFRNAGSANVKCCIETLEGVMEASVGDYIIRGINGELYSHKSDIFEQSYELVNQDCT